MAEEFEKGLKNFLSFVQTQDLNPRTIGATDYPTESPLDEVISTINECKGVIVLGYPQIVVEKGFIKSNQVEDILLPTEWNHIEASLAYSENMPLLIIHHTGIKRGIFDRGAISKFLYEKDLSENDWFLSEEINGALKRWKHAVLSHKEQKSKTSKTKKKKLAPSPEELKEEIKRVLVYFFENTDDSNRHVEAVAAFFRIDQETAQYYLDQLVEYGLIRASVYSQITAKQYHVLTSEGREYVVVNKLKNSL